MPKSNKKEEYCNGKTPNPLASRFNKVVKKAKNRFPRVAFVLQGGGAIGSYQFGVVKGLLEAGYEPDWISATSIGAIQAAIIVGNPPEKRIERLQEFWDRVAPSTLLDPLESMHWSQSFYNHSMAANAVLFGQPDFFSPRWMSGEVPVYGTPGSLSYYDTSPLRQTLLELVDFDLLNSCPIRLSLGSVQISTGLMYYFNNINYRIEVDHILASGALPPGFPAINIAGEYFWDGGVHSNSPLNVILEAKPEDNTLCFLIDCFGSPTYTPNTMDEVQELIKDISYGTHAQRTLLDYLQRQKLRHALHKLQDTLSKEQRAQCEELLELAVPHHTTLVHLVCNKKIVRTSSRDFNFSKVVMKKRIAVGYEDVQAILAHEKEWGFMPKDGQSRLYAAPNSHARLLHQAHQIPNVLR